MAVSVGKIYADALFSLASENGAGRGSADALLSDITEIGRVLDGEPEFTGLLTSRALAKDERAGIFAKVFGGDGYAQNLYKLLIRNNRLTERGAVIGEFRKLYNSRFKVEEVRVTSAMPLSDSAREKIISKLSDSLKKEIRLVENIDKSLIGGVVIDTSGGRLDGSVRTRLSQLQKTLSKC